MPNIKKPSPNSGNSFFDKKNFERTPVDIPKTQSMWEKFLFRLSMLGTGKEQDYFIENIATLLISGMGMSAALDAIKSELRTNGMKKIIENLKEEIEGGSSLWKALQKLDFLPERNIALIRIGEESGQLSANLKVIVSQQQKERSFRSKIRSAMMYPLLVLALTFAIGIAIAWFILPRLASVFTTLKIQLPLITKGLIGLGNFIGAYGFIVIPLLIIILTVAIYLVFLYPRTRYIGQWLLFHLPGIRSLIQDTELSRFGYLLGSLLEAGLPVVDALHSIEQATLFQNYKKLYNFLAIHIEEGDSFQKSFEQYPDINKLIPVPIEQLIIAAERSGKLSDALLHIGAIFEEKTDTSTKDLTVILEPILLVIVWAGVVTVALAVILPIYSLIGGLDTQNNPGATSETPVVLESEIKTPIKTVPPAVITPPVQKQIKIKTTELGYLNVRSDPSTKGEILEKVYPGQLYEYLAVSKGWYNIIFPGGKNGWVSERYVEIIPNTTNQ
ncbi:MAG TPA: type II secretion system F family protein [Candidatus Paceibacterota bacterium]